MSQQNLPDGYESPSTDPVSLRDGETTDVSAHTQANLAAIKEQEKRGELDEGTFERAAERHGVDPDNVIDDVDLLTECIQAAEQALEEASSDPTGSARYNRRRRYERAFKAAMDVLRDVPVEERPDGIVTSIDEEIKEMIES